MSSRHVMDENKMLLTRLANSRAANDGDAHTRQTSTLVLHDRCLRII